MTITTGSRRKLASLLGVDVVRLYSIPSMTCTRLLNGITEGIQEGHTFRDSKNPTYYELVRARNIGKRSAVALCTALGIPITLNHDTPREYHVPKPEILLFTKADGTPVELRESNGRFSIFEGDFLVGRDRTERQLIHWLVNQIDSAHSKKKACH